MEQTNVISNLIEVADKLKQLIKKELTNYKLTINEFYVIESLHNETNLTVQDLCSKVLIPNSSMTYVLDRLEEKALITRTRNVNDKRIIYVNLTESGNSLSNDLLPKHYNHMSQFFNVLSNDEIIFLQKILLKIGNNCNNND